MADVAFQLEYDNWIVGKVAFPADAFAVLRALDGVRLGPPFRLALDDLFGARDEATGWSPVLVRTVVDVTLKPENLYLGTHAHERWEQRGSSLGNVWIHVPYASVREIERHRGSGPVTFELSVTTTLVKRPPSGRQELVGPQSRSNRWSSRIAPTSGRRC